MTAPSELTDGPQVTQVHYWAMVPEWIIVHAELDALDVRIWAWLQRRAGKEGAWHVTYGHIGGLFGKSKDSVKRAIGRLETVGALTVEARVFDNQAAANRYHLHTDPPAQVRGVGAQAGTPHARVHTRKKEPQPQSPAKKSPVTHTPAASPKRRAASAYNLIFSLVCREDELRFDEADASARCGLTRGVYLLVGDRVDLAEGLIRELGRRADGHPSSGYPLRTALKSMVPAVWADRLDRAMASRTSVWPEVGLAPGEGAEAVERFLEARAA